MLIKCQTTFMKLKLFHNIPEPREADQRDRNKSDFKNRRDKLPNIRPRGSGKRDREINSCIYIIINTFRSSSFLQCSQPFLAEGLFDFFLSESCRPKHFLILKTSNMRNFLCTWLFIAAVFFANAQGKTLYQVNQLTAKPGMTSCI